MVLSLVVIVISYLLYLFLDEDLVIEMGRGDEKE
jgi:hypothetical protein